MSENINKIRVNLDGKNSLDITVNGLKKIVVAEIITADKPPELIYAEKFDFSCNYLKEAIKKGINYIEGNANSKNNSYFQSVNSKHLRTEYII